MGERTPLDDVELRLLGYLREQIREHGRTPPFATMAEAMGWDGVQSAFYRVGRMVEKGHLKKLGGHRGLEVVGEGKGFSLPVLGPVAAGAPLGVCDPDGDERFNFDERFGDVDNFMLKVRGESMVDAAILPGDYVVIRKRPEGKTGEEVVCAIDGEMTLKVYREIRDTKWLLPRNSKMNGIKIDSLKDTRVIGVLVGVVRFKR
jgi:repressor LexA